MMFGSLTDVLQAEFLGPQAVSALQTSRCRELPDQPGVYLVLRTAATEPAFLAANIGGHFKGRDPMRAEAVLKSQWVSGNPVIYIGRARDSLRKRVRRYMDFGLGKPVAHWGGRYIWQLAGSADLLVCWQIITNRDPGLTESELIQQFKRQFGRRPFANLRD